MKIRHDNAANDDLIASGRQFTAGAESDRDAVETAGRQVAASLNGGAGAEESAALHHQAYQRADEVAQASTRSTSTDQKTQDINAQAMPRIQQMFGNRG